MLYIILNEWDQFQRDRPDKPILVFLHWLIMVEGNYDLDNEFYNSTVSIREQRDCYVKETPQEIDELIQKVVNPPRYVDRPMPTIEE